MLVVSFRVNPWGRAVDFQRAPIENLKDKYFHKLSWGSSFGSRNNLKILGFSKRYSLTPQQRQHKGAKIQIILAKTLSNLGLGRNSLKPKFRRNFVDFFLDNKEHL